MATALLVALALMRADFAAAQEVKDGIKAPSVSDFTSVAPAGSESIDAYGIGIDLSQASQEARAGTVEEAILRLIGPDKLLTNWRKVVPILNRADSYIVSESILRMVQGKDGTYTIKLRANVNQIKLKQKLGELGLLTGSAPANTTKTAKP